MAIFMKLSKSSYSVEKSILSHKKGLFLRYKKLTRKFVLERVKKIFLIDVMWSLTNGYHNRIKVLVLFVEGPLKITGVMGANFKGKC